jgi:hypothetical protein
LKFNILKKFIFLIIKLNKNLIKQKLYFLYFINQLKSLKL